MAEPPAPLVCPITSELMSDPVMTADGHSYERSAILKWLETHDTSPLTGAVLPSKSLKDNHALSAAVDEWKVNNSLRLKRLPAGWARTIVVVVEPPSSSGGGTTSLGFGGASFGGTATKEVRVVFVHAGSGRQSDTHPGDDSDCSGGETQALPPLPPPLPEGWTQSVDSATGRVYFKNHVLQTTQWGRPGVAVAQQQQLPEGWTQKVDHRTGRPYYSNHSSKTTSWERPGGDRGGAEEQLPAGGAEQEAVAASAAFENPPNWAMQAVAEASAEAQRESGESGARGDGQARRSATPVSGAALLGVAFDLVLPRYRLLTKEESALAVGGGGSSAGAAALPPPTLSQQFVPVSRCTQMMRDLGFDPTQQQEFDWKDGDLAAMARRSQGDYKRMARAGAADGSGNKEEKDGVLSALDLLNWLQIKRELYHPQLPDRLVPGVAQRLAQHDSLLPAADVRPTAPPAPPPFRTPSSATSGKLEEPLLSQP